MLVRLANPTWSTRHDEAFNSKPPLLDFPSQAMPDKPNFVRASFGPPLISFLGKHGLTIRWGPKSSVALATTYVDERVRMGLLARLFIFFAAFT